MPVLAVISEYSQSVQEQHEFDDGRTRRRLQTFTHRSHDGGLPVEHCREQKAKVRKPEGGGGGTIAVEPLLLSSQLLPLNRTQ